MKRTILIGSQRFDTPHDSREASAELPFQAETYSNCNEYTLATATLKKKAASRSGSTPRGLRRLAYRDLPAKAGYRTTPGAIRDDIAQRKNMEMKHPVVNRTVVGSGT